MKRRQQAPSNDRLFVQPDDGPMRQATRQEVFRAARKILRDHMRPGIALTSTARLRDFLRFELGLLEHEKFSVILLDAQNRLIAYREMFRGTLAQTSVHPREVVKEALAHNAAGIILCHNHPSGCARPSPWDVELTRTLQASLALVGVNVVDHCIVARHEVMTFREEGLL